MQNLIISRAYLFICVFPSSFSHTYSFLFSLGAVSSIPLHFMEKHGDTSPSVLRFLPERPEPFSTPRFEVQVLGAFELDYFAIQSTAPRAEISLARACSFSYAKLTGGPEVHNPLHFRRPRNFAPATQPSRVLEGQLSAGYISSSTFTLSILSFSTLFSFYLRPRGNWEYTYKTASDTLSTVRTPDARVPRHSPTLIIAPRIKSTHGRKKVRLKLEVSLVFTDVKGKMWNKFHTFLSTYK